MRFGYIKLLEITNGIGSGEFIPELSKPVAKIFNLITSSSKYPSDWKQEFQKKRPKEKQSTQECQKNKNKK